MSGSAAILLGVAALALFPGAAHAYDRTATNAVGLTVQPLTFKLARTGVPLPVLVTILNPDPSLRGVVEARIGDGEGGHVWRQDIRFGRGRFAFFVYPQVTQDFPENRLTVRVLDTQHRSLADASLPIRIQGTGPSVSVLSLAGPGRRLASQDVNPKLAAVVSLRNSDGLPDRWYGYKAFDAVFWDACRTDRLPLPQEEALTDWVRSGGRLILGAKEMDSSLDSPVPQLVPSLTVVAPSPAGGGTRQGRMDVAEFGSGDPHALFVEKAFGLGRVVWLRVDFNSIGSWPESELARLMGIPPRPAPKIPATSPVRRARFSPSGSGTEALIEPVLARMAGYMTLRLTPILATMAIYILLVSVVDYGALRRLRRLPWTWLTFPAMIVLFSAIAFRFFYRGQIGSLSRHEVVFADVGRNGAGISKTLSCVRNNSNGPVEFPASMACFIQGVSAVASPYDYRTGGMGPRSDDASALSESVRGAGERTISIPGYVGSFRFFSEERVKRDAGLPFACRWQRGAGAIGQVVNNTGKTVKTGFIYFGDRIYSLGSDLRIMDNARNVEPAAWQNFDTSSYYRQKDRAPLEAVAECVMYQPFKLRHECEIAIEDARGRPDPYSGIFESAGENEGVLVTFSEEETEDRGMRVRRINCIRQVVEVALSR